MAMIEEIREERIEKVKELRKQGINPYPSKSDRTHMNSDITDDYDSYEGKQVTVAGRIMLLRDFGKLYFVTLRDGSGDIQLMVRKDEVGNAWKLMGYLDIGDFVDATGSVMKTKAGEITVQLEDITILAKAIRPLPEKWSGIKDDEVRFRKRYLDFLVNEDSKEKITTRSKILKFLRQFMWERGFIEIENPTLENNPAGAEARPFITHINAYDMDMYLRICMGELWQKMSTIGGFEKVFEIGRAYRNEGVDAEHNPEFSMLEFYWAYATIEDNIKLHQDLFSEMAKTVSGSYKVKYRGKEIDLTPPIKTARYNDLVKEYSGLDIEEFDDLDTFKEAAAKAGVEEIQGFMGWSSTIDAVWKQKVRPNIFEPVFVIEYPYVLTPLAKRIEGDDRYIQMSQLVMDGMEMCRMYGELNDPVDQIQRFKEHQDARAKGDEETWAADYEFSKAMEYGMPPQTGSGIGIDRWAKVLADAESLREVIAYPIMRPEGMKKPSGKVYELKKMIAILRGDLEGWPLTNTIGHITAYLGAQIGKENLLSRPRFATASNDSIPADSQFPLIAYSADEKKLHELLAAAEKEELVHIAFVQEMIDYADDDELEEALSKKEKKEMDILGLGLFGDTEVLKKLTKELELWK